jgi:hypothetical protein
VARIAVLLIASIGSPLAVWSLGGSARELVGLVSLIVVVWMVAGAILREIGHLRRDLSEENVKLRRDIALAFAQARNEQRLRDQDAV